MDSTYLTKLWLEIYKNNQFAKLTKSPELFAKEEIPLDEYLFHSKLILSCCFTCCLCTVQRAINR